MLETYEFWMAVNFYAELLAYLRNDKKWSAVWNAGGLGIRFRNEQLKQAAARRTTGAGEAQQAVEECQPGPSRRKQQFTAKVYVENGLPAEILAFRVKMERIGVCRRDGALSYLIVGNGFEYYIRTVLTTTNERYFNEFVSGLVPKKQWYYGSQWFAPPAETTDSYRQITQLLESCNGPMKKWWQNLGQFAGRCADDPWALCASRNLRVCASQGGRACPSFELQPGAGFKVVVVCWWPMGEECHGAGEVIVWRPLAPLSQPLGHNSFLFSPAQLRKAGILFEFHVQRPGDAVLTVGLHCGINIGASVCLVKELCNHRAARQFKLIGQKTRCDCNGREFYQYSEEQSQEYLQGVKEMESSAMQRARKLRYEQSGHRERTTSKEQLASQLCILPTGEGNGRNFG